MVTVTASTSPALVTDALLREMRAVVGRANLLHERIDLQTYEYDAYGLYSLPGAVVFVQSTDEVVRIVKMLNREKVPFVARGFGTNVSGGSLALNGAVVIELGRMNKVLEIDIADLCVTVQPGIFTADISTALAPYGYYYAPDPASMRASSVGGNIAENAGGPHCFKYGVTSNHVLGLEVVLPDGEVVRLGGKNGDPPGLDLRGAFIGSEGTFGIVTAAVLRILRKPEALKTMLVAFPTLEDAGNVVSDIVAAGLVPATLELMDQNVVVAIEDALACGYPREAGAVVLMEVDGLADGMDELTEQIAAISRNNHALEVRIAQNETERAALWRGRQGSFGSITRLAPNNISLDGVVPRTMLPEALRQVRAMAGERGLRVFCTLHAGDGNLHPMFLYDGKEPGAAHSAEEAALATLHICASLGGTVSGEHGIGIEKIPAMRYVFGDGELRAQRLLKDAWDPENLCNPGKVLPEA